MDGIIDFSYEEEEAKISFKMESFQPFVLIQQTYTNFPFQSWELRPLGQDSALLTITGALMDLSIVIKVRELIEELSRRPSNKHETSQNGPKFTKPIGLGHLLEI